MAKGVSEEVTRRRFELCDALLGLFRPGKVVDLGAGHGAFSIRAAAAGWDVTAIDARTERWPDASQVKWVEADVRQADLAGYDVILCLGLFYHLTPEDQLTLLGRASGTPMIIDTHIANGRSTHKLSEEVDASGYRGRWYAEGLTLTSSWGNRASFWPTLESFHSMLAEHGYRVVTTVEPWYMPDRTFFLALPGESPAP